MNAGNFVTKASVLPPYAACAGWETVAVLGKLVEVVKAVRDCSDGCSLGSPKGVIRGGE